jgi:hypothetical protein
MVIPMIRRSQKYKNTPTVIGDRRFASKAEAQRFIELSLLQRVGQIADLECQPRFPLVVNGVKVCTYVADFRYSEVATGRVIIEDVKGVRTREFVIKKKLMAAVHGIDIQEVSGS